MPATLKFKGGNTAQEDLRIGATNELTVDTEALELRLHDGSTPGGKAIGSGGGGMPSGVYDSTGNDYMLLPHNISKLDGGATHAGVNIGVFHAAWFLFPTPIADLGTIIRTADAGSTDTRVSIYTQHATSGLPETLLFGSGDLNAAVTGYQSETLGAPIVLHGLYWFGVKTDSATVNSVSFNNTGGYCWGHPLGMGDATGRAQMPKTVALVGAWPTDITSSLDGTTNRGDVNVVGYNGV